MMIWGEPYLSITERGLRTPFDRAVDRAAAEMRRELEEARRTATRPGIGG